MPLDTPRFLPAVALAEGLQLPSGRVPSPRSVGRISTTEGDPDVTRQDLVDEIASTLSSLRVARASYEHADVFTDPDNERQMVDLRRRKRLVEDLTNELNELLDQVGR
ncbi:hypothetical protein [Rhodococcus triatomae]